MERFKMMIQSSRKTPSIGNQTGGSQEASLGAMPPSIYITRDEMETMMNGLQEKTIACQEEMMVGFFRRTGRIGMTGVMKNWGQG